MNPIALIEAPAAARRAVLGALATDPIVPGRTAATPASHPDRRSARPLAATAAVALAVCGLGVPAGSADDGKSENILFKGGRSG